MIPRRPLLWLALLIVALALGVAALMVSRTARVPKPATSMGWPAAVTTAAGDGSPGRLDGRAQGVRFSDPFGVGVDRDGVTYIADAGDNNVIRRLSRSGSVLTLAGGREGFADGRGGAAAFNTPSGLAVDALGSVYVADTGNNAVRRVTPDGWVTTIAGNGSAGDRDGRGRAARFNGPVGLAVDTNGRVFVADTYNDRIRRIAPDGTVVTIAGGTRPGYRDAQGTGALFDTPSGVAVNSRGDLFIADTGNDVVRKLSTDGTVSTVRAPEPIDADADPLRSLSQPVGIAVTHDDFVYVTDRRGRVIQISPEGRALVLAGRGAGFANGSGQEARFNNPAGVAVDGEGALRVADAGNYLLRAISPRERASRADIDLTPIPRLTAGLLGIDALPWPLEPQRSWHELAGTIGEPRGSLGSDGRARFHAGADVPGRSGEIVRAVRTEKVQHPISAAGIGGASEHLAVGIITYTHLRVGRDRRDRMLDPGRFNVGCDESGTPDRVRVKRGTWIRTGDALGTLNRLYHVHIDVGPRGGEVNPLDFPLIGFSDHVAPVIEPNGIRLFDSSGRRLVERRRRRLVLCGPVQIVVDAYDRVDGNLSRRRLGIYKLGYQVLRADGSPVSGFDQPRITMEFDRLPAEPSAPRLAYAEGSGITVYGNRATRFLYTVTNTVRHGIAEAGMWDAGRLPPGDYLLRILAADHAGNVAASRRDLAITIEPPCVPAISSVRNLEPVAPRDPLRGLPLARPEPSR